MGLAPVRWHGFPKHCRQLVRLLAPFRGVQTKMGGDDPQHSLAGAAL